MIRKTIAIDIGSTNSQMARIYESSSDNGRTWESLPGINGEIELFKDDKGSANFPSVIIRKCDLTKEQLEQNLFQDDCIFGDNAEAKLEKFYGDVKITSEFKKDFFKFSQIGLAAAETETLQKTAADNIELFLQLLNKREKETAQKSDYTEERLILTMPVRATGAEKEEMIKLAENAGWKNIEILDEATSAFRYFLARHDLPLKDALSECTVNQQLKVLLIDLGGSTTDILLSQIRPDGKGSFVIDILGEWPEVGVTNTLGGIEMDKSVCDWLLYHEYLIPKLVENSILKIGYKNFRIFKEDNLNERLSDDYPVEKLNGPISDLTWIRSNPQDIIYSEADYEEINSKKINLSVYLNEIARKYFLNQQDAIRELLKSGNTAEDEIDFICLSGGGSKLLGIDQLLTGTFPGIKKPLNFTKILENPSHLLKSNKKIDPSAICVAGAISNLPYLNFRFYCPYNLHMTVEIYCENVSELNSKSGIFTARPKFLNDFKHKVFCKKYEKLIKVNKSLPLEEEIIISDDSVFTCNYGNSFLYVISLYSQTGENPEVLQMIKTSSSFRTLTRTVKDFFGTMTSSTTWKCNMSYQIKLYMDENRRITISPKFNADGIFGFNNQTVQTQG